MALRGPRGLPHLIALCFLALAAPAQAQDPAVDPGGARIVLTKDADYFGYDLRTLKDVSLDTCKQACLADSACGAFTYNSSAKWCFLKSDYGQLKAEPGAIAGSIVRAAADRPVKAPPPPRLTFLPGNLEPEARRFALMLRAAGAPSPASRRRLEAEAAGAVRAGDARLAAERYRAILAGGGEAPAWSALARALLATQAANYQEQSQLLADAALAALNGYSAAAQPPQRAEPLALLAAALERQQLFRPALEAYKASLAAADSALVRAAYERLRAERGFRVTDYSVDADAASPRICVQFSEPLAGRNSDYASFVTLDEKPAPALEAEEQQLCIEGVSHGARYRVGLRAGLPSRIGEALTAPLLLNVYVRDRSSAVRFTGSNYILPRSGAHAIPLVSVNAESIEIDLYRIADRALAQSVAAGDFLSQLDGFSAEKLEQQLGRRLWRGSLAVETRLNEEVTTGFPVDDVVKDPAPGVYVMIARPGGARLDAWEARATQWFIVSDLALTSLAGSDGIHAFVRSLTSARPVPGARLALVARNNEVLGEAVSDGAGHALFAPGLARGQGGAAPALVTAMGADGDYAFLDLTGPAFDLSDRGVAGRPAPAPIDAFLYTERGIYRPGETVHALTLLRDASVQAVGDVPLSLIVRRPDGVEYRRVVVSDSGLGGHHLALQLPANAMRGTWQLAAHADTGKPALAETRFMVEDFIPDRIEFDLAADAESLPRDGAVTASVEGRFLYGAPAAGLKLAGEVTIRPTKNIGAFPGFHFGLAEEEAPPQRSPLYDLPATDARGEASFALSAGELPDSAGPLEAALALRMQESGGRAVERVLTLPVSGGGPFVGIRPLFADGHIGEKQTAGFELIAVDGQGRRIALSGLRWQLLKVNRSYQWYRVNGSWSYEPVEATSRVGDGTLDIAADASATLSAGVEWGDYRLVVSGAGGVSSSYSFAAGWHVADASAETPDNLQIGLDKEAYAPGDTARLSFEAAGNGQALIAVMGERLIETREIAVTAGRVDVDLTVSGDWGAGAYVSVTLMRGSAATGHQPARAIGLAWAGVDPGARRLAVSFEAPEIARPAQSLDLPLRIAGLAPGEEARVVVAAVDVGILNVTAYEPPDPAGWYFGQRRLGVEIRDLFGRLVEGAATAGRIRSGGDFAPVALAASPPEGDPVALFSGVVTVDEKGGATVSFAVPQFNGTLRLMAVAWSRDRVGHGVADVTVRDPVVLTASLPRFLAAGDSARLRLDIANTDGQAGAYHLETTGDGALAVGGEGRDLTLAAGQRMSLDIPVAAASLGAGHIAIALSGPDGTRIGRDLTMSVRPSRPPVSERRLVTLAPGEKFSIDSGLLAGYSAGSGAVTLSISPAARLDLPSLLQALDRYPYGCAEQTTSRALPLLYLSAVAAAAGLGDDAAIRDRVQQAIGALMSYQASNGSFGLWGPGEGDLWLDSYVSDFLSRAAALGFAVPERALAQALDNLANSLAYTDVAANGGADTAYALYVLARNRRAAIGDLRYYADSKLDAFSSPLARAQLAAALALYGERGRASATFAAGLSGLAGEDGNPDTRRDYGSPLRDGAAMLTLAAEASPPLAPLSRLVDFVAEQRDARRYTSTQENAWLLMAANGLLGSAATAKVSIDGEAVMGNLLRRFSAARLEQGAAELVNEGGQPLELVLTVSGVPEKAAPAGGEGFEIRRSYYTLDGAPADPALVNQNQRLVVTLEVTEAGELPSHLLVVDMLPAGFEIANPALVDSADLAALSWLPEKVEAARLEFRDDRFVAALERSGNEARGFTLAYMVRAVTPGRFALPPALVEDMYRPHLNARTASGRSEVIGIEP